MFSNIVKSCSKQSKNMTKFQSLSQSSSCNIQTSSQQSHHKGDFYQKNQQFLANQVAAQNFVSRKDQKSPKNNQFYSSIAYIVQSGEYNKFGLLNHENSQN